MSRGFFVPNSIGEDYVYNQKTVEGDYKWDRDVNRIQLNKQAGLQTLNKQYNITIDQAYSQYLMANKGIQGSQMGQGYKEAYIQESQRQLQEQVAESNINAANARRELGNLTDKSLGNLQEQYEIEVSNINRTSASLQNYFDYLKGASLNPESAIFKQRVEEATKLKQDPWTTYFSKDEENMLVDDMYEALLNASPMDYIDAEGNKAVPYIDWVQRTIKDTERDQDWGDWLFNKGGLTQFRTAVSKGIKKQ